MTSVVGMQRGRHGGGKGSQECCRKQKGIKSGVDKPTTKSVVEKTTTKRVTSVVDGLAKRGERTAVGCIRLCNAAQMTMRTACIDHHRTPQHQNIHADKLGMRGEVVSSKPNKLAL